ncbi:MAG: YcgL domain-containing protein [Porticoccaceae bacterium]|jgi:uncharacterized protein YcgL (UPF0745 family)
MSHTLFCEIYKSLREEEMYLFVDKKDQLSKVPAALLNHFGKTQLVTTLALTPERKLARANAASVIESIIEQGYYLQMPPRNQALVDNPMEQMGARNEKLPR